MKISNVDHLYAGKPVPFGPRSAPSSIVKAKHQSLLVKYDGAMEDEQGNKKLHGGPMMALHQYSQASYKLLKAQFPSIAHTLNFGTIGENISAPNMQEDNTYIGDQYRIGDAILQVVSPRAPCSKINHRYQLKGVDLFVAEKGITGWYYSVLQEGKIVIGDTIELIKRENAPISVKQIWTLRQLNAPSNQDKEHYLALAETAFNLATLAPEWQAHMHRIFTKLSKL